MTDTGQVPGEGLPESAGMVEQPGVPAHGAYTYLSESPAEDEDLLLPGAQGAWGNEVPPPPPEPVVETVHEPGPHETDGRDSGSVDLSAVRLPNSVPASPILSVPHDPATAPAPRRPLHLGPPIPDASASPVRSLADRGPAGAPAARQPGLAVPGPEYLDAQPMGEAAPQPAAPWGAPQAVPHPAAQQVAPVAQVAAQAPAAETVVPAVPAPEAVAAPEPVAVAAAPAAAPGHLAAGGTAVTAEQQAPAGPGVWPESAYGPEGVAQASEAGAAMPAAVPAAPWGAAAPDGVQTPLPEPAPPVAEAPHAGLVPQIPLVPQVPDAPRPVPVPQVQEAPRPTARQDTAPAPGAVPAPDAAAEPAGPPTDAVTVEPAAAAEPAQPLPVPPAPPVAPEPEAPEPAGPEQAAAPVAPEPFPAPETVLPEPLPVPPAVPAHPAEEIAEAPAAEAAAETPQPLAAPATEQPTAETVAAAGFQAAAVVPQAEPAVAPEAPEPLPVQPPAGPQIQDAAPEALPEETSEPQEPAAAEAPAPPAQDRPLGEFVAVDGQVPTTPHLAPTPPHPLVLPAQDMGENAPEQAATVPAPREAEPGAQAEPRLDVVQHAEDLETRAADQEESTAPVAEAPRSTGPAAPAYDDAEREAVLKVMRERRDIRNGFRGDPIPHEVLLRVLEAAHTAPSVGHSQPWDFVVIRSADTRRSMHELAMRQRDAYAKSLPKGRAKQFKELKIEAILDTPVNIVVTADPTRGGRHTLGRHTQPQMAPYSAALAVENLWLAARAEGLGVGWVSFFDEREMVRALGLPEHLEVIAYLCVGYVDEFPDEPELMQAGWSKRRPLSWVVHEETYGRRALPGEDPHDLLAETVAGIRPLDAKALGEAWERQKRMTKPAGALGMLEIISAQLSGLSRQCPPPIPEPAAVAIFAGDHGVHAQGVTPWPQEVTAQMVANFLGGGAVCNAFASQVGAEVCVVDVGVASELPATPGLLPRKVRAGTSDMTTGPAMTREEAKQAIEVGIETARDLVAAGNKALLTGEMGIANTTASAALISVYTGADPAEVTGRGTGINDETLARKTEVVRRALDLHQPDPADPIGVLAAIGGFEHAAMVGLLLGGASLRTPVILDGVSAGAAALVARAIAPEVLAACIAGHRSAEPGHVAALNKLGLRPLVDLDLRLGEGTGALLALPLVQSTARAMHEVATFDSAGVTEK
ncbi:nicotinate-nucleotide--dimethylbenzimidazole phosphoribosyltransferase [Streptomyces sp. NPDC101237]|uniref:nicotinate-nucleotide--dimethylbenzimidazole phosphoribosyltransferase n=1 Tax=Streptomyces sp. NPDC101237 TaxID=3366139 RepID=UPI00380621BE